MKSKKLYLFVLFIIVIGSASLWLYWRFGGFIKLEGTLIGSISYNHDWENEAGSIYSLSLGKPLKLEKFLDCEQTEYEELSFPTIREQDFICAAKQRNAEKYAVLKVSDGKMTEIMTADKKISFPVLQNQDTKLIYIEGEKNNAYLYKYDVGTKTSQKIVDEPVDANSRVQTLPDGSLVFVVIEKSWIYKSLFFVDSGSIEMIDASGNRRKLAEGRFPVWYEAGKSMFYYDNQTKRLIFYDIESGARKNIKDIRIESQLVVSPDKKYIAFDEGVNVDGTIARQLIVVPVDGRNELSILYQDRWMFGGLDGLNWLAPNN
jgi:hypothetical protein